MFAAGGVRHDRRLRRLPERTNKIPATPELLDDLAPGQLKSALVAIAAPELSGRDLHPAPNEELVSRSLAEKAYCRIETLPAALLSRQDHSQGRYSA
jgi:hypothetical protein